MIAGSMAYATALVTRSLSSALSCSFRSIEPLFVRSGHGLYGWDVKRPERRSQSGVLVNVRAAEEGAERKEARASGFAPSCAAVP